MDPSTAAGAAPDGPGDQAVDRLIAPSAERPPTVAVAPARRAPMVAIAVAVVAVLTGSALFVSGFSLGRRSATEPGTPVGEDGAFRPFWDTYETIRDRYAGGTVDREALIQGAIRGMIQSLDDPYSSYLSSSEYRQSLESLGGRFEGIGAEIGTESADGTPGCTTLGPACRLIIVAPIVGSPAQRAGLAPGDRVLATDGAPLDGLTVDGARDRLRGPKGSVVHLSIQRGSARPFDLAITRDVIETVEVETRTLAGGTVGYVALRTFSDASARELRDALKAHVDAGRSELILDLRGDPGGYVTAAREVASQFIASGPVFWEETADGTQTSTDAIPGGVATDPAIRVVCLVDGGSASASEIVAGALQDTKRATLVGRTTFGKGTVQQWQELTGEGGAFRLTVAKWLTPGKRWIHHVGLTPDIVVDPAPSSSSGTDPILDRGLEVLGGGASLPAPLSVAA